LLPSDPAGEGARFREEGRSEVPVGGGPGMPRTPFPAPCMMNEGVEMTPT